jgi:hypothetical protein
MEKAGGPDHDHAGSGTLLGRLEALTDQLEREQAEREAA